MKQCTTCRQTYSDDMLFCLSDGTPLVALLDEAEQPTVVRSTPTIPTAKSTDGSGSMFKYIAAALGALLILVLIGGVAAVWFLWPRSGTTEANTSAKNDAAATSPTPFAATPDSRNADRSDLKKKEEELERESRRIADERKKLEEDKRQKAETVEPDLPQFKDPGPARISFRRGSVGETVSGTVGRSRSYVLRTLPGQYLSASIRSAGGCVVFSGGSANTGFTTGAGDTRLNVQNTCDKPSTFSMSVSVR